MSLDLGPMQAFLRDLAANNDRDWFHANKARYDRDVKGAAEALCRAVEADLATIDPELVVDPRVNGSIMRLNRDLRFSKDKTPYRDWVGVRIYPHGDKKSGRSAMLFRVMPGSIGVATGVFGFNKEMRDAYREAMAGPDGEAVVGVIDALVADGAHVTADSLKRAPKPWGEEHPRAEWLKHKGLVVGFDEAVEPGPGVVAHVVERWRQLAPVHQFLRLHCG